VTARKVLYRSCFCVLALLWAILILSGPLLAADPPVKNVIVLIMDGCSDEQLTLARWYKGEPLALDAIRTGAVKTHTREAVIADSAPAASAYATGVRTGGTVISLTPQRETSPGAAPGTGDMGLEPRATVLEGARLLGKATGIVVTSRLGHATPAAYMAHAPARDRESDITEQAVYQNIDVVFGGGRRFLLPANAGGARRDQEDLTAVLRARSSSLIDKADELQNLKKPKVFGLFAPSHLEPEIDRPQFAPEQPSLAAMTRKAIELLSQNPKGFFLMVEGSQIDWAGHANDPAHLLRDLLIFDQAVQIALDFAAKNGQTLVLALPDHNTGGMSIGNRRSDNNYTDIRTEDLIAPLKKMQLSAPGLWRQVGEDKTPEKIKEVVLQYWGIALTQEDAQEILKKAKLHGKEAHYALGEVICPKYTHLGWTTHGHTGGDVPLFAFGPGRPIGLLDAPDIGWITAAALGLDLDKLTRRLFVDARQAFPGQAVRLDRSNPDNPVLTITHQGRQATLPVNKNNLQQGGETTELEGVVIYISDTDRVFMPLQAVHLIRGEGKSLPDIRN